jgi:hypothetical protein
VEYLAVYNKMKLHFYGRARFTGGKVILATATATVKQWEKYQGELIDVVDSLSLTK